jgi:hypothetical protein
VPAAISTNYTDEKFEDFVQATGYITIADRFALHRSVIPMAQASWRRIALSYDNRGSTRHRGG